MGKVPVSQENQTKFGINLSGAEGFGKGNLAVGIVGVVIACLGCLTGKCRNPFYAIPYGILTFGITIAFIVISILASILASETGQKAVL